MGTISRAARFNESFDRKSESVYENNGQRRRFYACENEDFALQRRPKSATSASGIMTLGNRHYGEVDMYDRYGLYVAAV